jgi:integrase
MASKKLTEAQVANARVPDGKSRVVLWDGGVTGFGLRCSKSGAKSFILMYRPQGLGRTAPSRTLTLGRWPDLSIEQARSVARARIGEVAHGKDPAAALRDARQLAQGQVTNALSGYEASLQRRKVVNIPTIMSCLRRGLARLARREVANLTRGDYVKAIEAIEAQGKKGAAEYLRKNVRTFAEWAVTQGLAPHNPLAGLRRPKATRAERLQSEARGRALSDSELQAIWKATGEPGNPFHGLVRLAFLTAMRRDELANLTWAKVKLDRIVLEAPETKQGRRHEIPLSGMMADVLASIPRNGPGFVFASWKTGGKLSGWSKMLPKLVSASGVDFTLHDARRTCRTRMTDLGVPFDIAEISIGHQRSDLVRRYDFSDVWAQRVDAFERVSLSVQSAVARENVVPIRVRGIVPSA